MAKIIGIKLSQRIETSTRFQEILTEYGCSIRTRLGIHNVTSDSCASDGVVLLDVVADDEIINNMINEFASINGLNYKIMIL